jgi:hypothetical protein
MCFSLSDWKDVFTITGVIVSFTLLLLALVQYRKAEKQKSAEHFFKLRDKYNTDATFVKIREIIDSPDNRDISSREINIDDKRKFLGFYEEIAIMVKSGLIKEELAFYMFGYYAVRCNKMDAFTSYINEDKEYWEIFSEFAAKMKNYDDNIKQFDYDKVVIE